MQPNTLASSEHRASSSQRDPNHGPMWSGSWDNFIFHFQTHLSSKSTPTICPLRSVAHRHVHLHSETILLRSLPLHRIEVVQPLPPHAEEMQARRDSSGVVVSQASIVICFPIADQHAVGTTKYVGNASLYSTHPGSI